MNYTHGYYSVGDKTFVNKIEALTHASKIYQPVIWDFNSDVYGAIDWTKKPSGTLRELYRDRAQQIRDKYDYVILNFSGGMDSWTMLHSFFSNNIHVDEVYTRWSLAQRKYKDPDPFDTSEYNKTSEFEYAVMPTLKYIETNFPKTKITIHDYSDKLQTALHDDDFLLVNKFQNMSTFFKYNYKSNSELLQESHGKKIGIIAGWEKINYEWRDDNFYAYFVDVSDQVAPPERNVELFYWSIDFPSIPILQAHCLKEYIITNPSADYLRIKTPDKWRLMRHLYHCVCYPDYDISTFQVEKPAGSLIWNSESWTYNYNPKFVQSWVWGIKQIYNGINDKFVRHHDTNNLITGLHPFRSPAPNGYLV